MSVKWVERNLYHSIYSNSIPVPVTDIVFWSSFHLHLISDLTRLQWCMDIDSMLVVSVIMVLLSYSWALALILLIHDGVWIEVTVLYSVLIPYLCYLTIKNSHSTYKCTKVHCCITFKVNHTNLICKENKTL